MKKRLKVLIGLLLIAAILLSAVAVCAESASQSKTFKDTVSQWRKSDNGIVRFFGNVLHLLINYNSFYL